MWSGEAVGMAIFRTQRVFFWRTLLRGITKREAAR